MIDLSREPVRTITKAMQTQSNRVKLTQKQMGAISPKVRAEVRLRSGGRCEIRKHCVGAVAVVQAHLKGRRIIGRKTTADDLRDACTTCHTWFDEQPDGIKYKRTLRGETK